MWSIPGQGPAFPDRARAARRAPSSRYGVECRTATPPTPGYSPAASGNHRRNPPRRLGRAPRCAVEVAKDVLASAVENIEECDPIAPSGVFRSKHVEVSRKRHASVRIARRLVEIDDGLIAGMRGIDGEKHLPDDLLVGAGRAEGIAVENIRARSNLDSRHLGLRAITRAGDRGGDQRTSEPQYRHCDLPYCRRASSIVRRGAACNSRCSCWLQNLAMPVVAWPRVSSLAGIR